MRYKKKHYDVLREELHLDKNEEELDSEIEELRTSKCSHSRSSHIKKTRGSELSDVEIQTPATDYITPEELDLIVSEKMREFEGTLERIENDFSLKLKATLKEKNIAKSELSAALKKAEIKRRQMKELEQTLRHTRGERRQKEKVRDELVNKIIELWQWKGGPS